MEFSSSRFRILPIFAAILFAASSAWGQTTCSPSASSPVVRAEGLTEPVGAISIVCVGGTAGALVNFTFFVTLNVNITNRLDTSGNPTFITVTVNTGIAGAVSTGTQSLYSPSSLEVQNATYSVPTSPSTPVTITISGIKAAASQLPTGSTPAAITASIAGIGGGIQFPVSNSVQVGVASPSLLTSVINNGVPCNGSPAPATLDLPGFINASAVFSTIRLTEASPAAFTAKDVSTDTGSRIVIRLGGYSPGARVFVPDVIVGSDGTSPTSAGGFNSTVSGGTYTPLLNQLLLIRIGGADANGNGGFFAVAAPTAQTSYSTFSEIGLVSGSGYAVYEVVNANPNLMEIAQVPIFLYAPAVACSTTPVVITTVTAAIAPISTVASATNTDPIPRFIASTPGSDCQQDGDCSALYFSHFSVDTSPVNVGGASLGSRVGANINLSNTGGGVIPFTTSITYSSGASGWLTIAPSSGQVTPQAGLSLQVFADPSTLQPGIYTATISINGGSSGTFTIPVTFTVGAPGVTISNVLNAASGSSPVAPGSYVALYGLNLGGQNVSVTFSGLNATIIFANATQINLIVPMGLGSAPAADVLVRVDGKTSNSFKVSLAANAPGIFNPGIENADASVNSSTNPAQNGSFVAVYFTGLAVPLTGQVTVNIGNQTNLIPIYAGAQPTLSALDQVNVTIPTALAGTANPVPLTICIPGAAGLGVCSNSVNLYIK